MEKEEINPLLRIADALESIAKNIEKFANPVLLCKDNMDIVQIKPFSDTRDFSNKPQGMFGTITEL